MIPACCSYCCARVESPLPSSKIRASWVCWDLCPGGLFPPRFFGFGMGEMNSARRRLSTIFRVGWPSPSSSQCPAGIAVRGVEDRVLEESVVHVRPPPAVVSVGLVPVTGKGGSLPASPVRFDAGERAGWFSCSGATRRRYGDSVRRSIGFDGRNADSRRPCDDSCRLRYLARWSRWSIQLSQVDHAADSRSRACAKS